MTKKEAIYGFVCVDDPRDFLPDEESCAPEELAAHAAALAQAEVGNDWTRPSRPRWVGDVHLVVSSWGIGTNWVETGEEGT